MLAEKHGGNRLTSLVFFELNIVLEIQFISIHFGIKTVVFLKNTGQTPSPGVYRTPMSNCFHGINLRQHVVYVTLPKALDRHALDMLA